jgi:hypothetical protein
VDIAWVVGIVVTGVAYWLLTRNLDLEAERGAIEASERELRQMDDEAEVAEASRVATTPPGSESVA